MDESLDDALEIEAARQGTSKAALIRQSVAARYGRSTHRDAIDALVGSFDGKAGESIDDVVYG
jgi:predicted ATP-grasp superfamily ATP-dependent carboligase